MISQFLSSRPIVFALALLSFACLLGQFYGVWSMHLFGCWVLPPATGLLVYIAYRNRQRPADLRNPHTWIVQGAFAGVIAGVAYDLFRLPFVLAGAPLFKVFPRFGELLLGNIEPRWVVHTLGWGYHFSNAAALGVMFLAMISWFSRPNLIWSAVLWALWIEGMLLLTPYTAFFGLKLDGRFLFLTLTAHLIFGLTLGAWLAHRLRSIREAHGGDGAPPSTLRAA